MDSRFRGNDSFGISKSGFRRQVSANLDSYKITVLIIACIFLLNNIAYGIDLPRKYFLRKPLDFNGLSKATAKRWYSLAEEARLPAEAPRKYFKVTEGDEDGDLKDEIPQRGMAELRELEQRYGFLPASHPTLRFVRSRLNTLLYDVPSEERPIVQVLASRHLGVNACAFPNGTILISPELIEAVEYVDELDFVLLHEINHIMRKHGQAAGKAMQSTWRKFAGTKRYQEYESDIAAFYAASDAARGTNPQGGVIFLERLRKKEYWDEGKLSGDLAHGNLTDRILNLKFIARFIELFHLEKELRPIDKTLVSGLFDQRSGVISFISEIPAKKSPGYARWEEASRQAIPTLNWEELIALLRIFSFRPLKENTAPEWLLKSFRERWEALLRRDFKWANQTQSDLITLFLWGFQSDMTMLKAAKDSLLGSLFFSAYQRINQDKHALEHIAQAFSFVNGIGDLDSSKLDEFFIWLIEDQLGDQAAYDKPDGTIDIKRYFQDVLALIAQADGFSRKRGIAWDASRIWTHALVTCVLTLADVGQWDSEKRDLLLKLIQPVEKRFIISIPQVEIILSRWEKTNNEAVELAQDLLLQHWDITVVLRKAAGSSRESILAKDSQHAQDKAVFDSALAENRLDLDNQEHLALMKRMAGSLRNYQESYPNMAAEEARSLFVGMPDIVGERQYRAVIRFAQVIAVDSFEYSRILSTLTVPSFQRDRVRKLTLIADLSQDFKGVKDIFGFSSQVAEDASGLKEIDRWKEEALNALQKDIAKIKDVDEWFGEVDGYLRNWAVPSGIMEADGDIVFFDEVHDVVIGSHHKILSSGAAFLKAAPVKPGDVIMLRRLLMLSFFAQNFEVRRTMQEFAVGSLIRYAPFKAAVSTIFSDYIPQSLLIGSHELELLDERVETQEDLDLLSEAGAQWLHASGTMQQLGTLALAESGYSTLSLLQDKLRQSGVSKKELLLALLATRNNDRQAKDALTAIWFSLTKDLVAEYIITQFHGVKLPQDLQKRIQKVRKRKQISVYEIWDSIMHDRFDTNIDTARFIDIDAKILDSSASPELILRQLYLARRLERGALMRFLLLGEGGAIVVDDQGLLSAFLNNYVRSDADEHLLGVTRDVFSSVLDVMSNDDIFLTLSPLLQDRIAMPPVRPSDWQSQVDILSEKVMGYCLKRVALDSNSLRDLHQAYNALYGSVLYNAELDIDELDTHEDASYGFADVEEFIYAKRGQNQESYQALQREVVQNIRTLVRAILEKIIEGAEQSIGKSDDELLTFLPEGYAAHRAGDVLTSLQFILESARQFGAPGVRFLQLLGQTIDIPAQYRQEFLQVYDSIRGQSKVNAWQTIKRVLPEYADQIKRLGRRIGGGSLFTVYEVELTNGDIEVVRVLNPNARFHARRSLEMMRDAIDELAEKDTRYAQVRPLITLLEQWIDQELADESFESDDQAFYRKWNNKFFNSSKTRNIVVPQSIPTGTPYVRREKLIKGKNFSFLSEYSPQEQKEAVALSAQHYFAQIMGGNVLSRVLNFMSDTETLVHSDISPGNLCITTEGNVAIFDRGMYLKFNKDDRRFLYALARAVTAEERIGILVKWAIQNNGTVEHPPEEAIIQEIIQDLRATGKSDAEDMLLYILISIHKYKLTVPLKFTLLFKNMNALNRMAKQVGFSGLTEALEFQKSSASPPSKRHVDIDSSL